jgi:ferredoxin
MADDSTPLFEVGLDLERCTGCQACVELCPEVFGWDETTELPFLKTSQSTEAEVLKAAAFCPKDCISIESSM